MTTTRFAGPPSAERLQLMTATYWLHPLSLIPDDDRQSFSEWAYGGERDAAMWHTLEIVCSKDLLPIYQSALNQIHHGASAIAVEHWIIEQLSSRYPHIPFDDIERFIYGPPLEFYGLPTTQGWFTDDNEYADIVLLLKDFGAEPDPTYGFDYDDLHEPYQASKFLIWDLVDQSEDEYIQIAWFIKWLFSATDNTLADYCDDEFWDAGFPELFWCDNDLKLVDEMYAEAAIIVPTAMAGRELLSQYKRFRKALVRNFKQALVVYQGMSREEKQTHGSRGTPSDNRPIYRWPRPIAKKSGPNPERAALTRSARVLIRPDSPKDG